MGTIQEDYPDMCVHGWSDYWLCDICKLKHKNYHCSICSEEFDEWDEIINHNETHK